MSHTNSFSDVTTETLENNATTIWSRHPDIIGRKVTSEFVLVPLRQAQVDMQMMYNLNPVGAFLWNELKTGQTQSALVASLLAHYVVSVEQAHKDVSDFLTQLYNKNLVICEPPNAETK